MAKTEEFIICRTPDSEKEPVEIDLCRETVEALLSKAGVEDRPIFPMTVSKPCWPG